MPDRDNDLHDALRARLASIHVPDSDALINGAVRRGHRKQRRRLALGAGGALMTLAAVAAVAGFMHASSEDGRIEPAGTISLSPSPARTSDPAAVIASKSALAAGPGGSAATGTPPSHLEGIFVDTGAPASTMDIRATTRWTGQVDGDWYSVWAGASGTSPAAGAVLVLPLDSASGSKGALVALPGAGLLHITAASHGVLTCTDAHGIRHTFSVRSRAWVGK